MLNQKFLNRVNTILQDKTFNYNGDILMGIPTNIVFKIEFLGYRDMIRIGELQPYLKVKLTIIELNDNVSKLILATFRKTNEKSEITKLIQNHLNYFVTSVTNYIESVVSFFDNEHNNVIIDEYVLDFPDYDSITEQRSSRKIVRDVVRDIVNLLKNKSKGEFRLPDDDSFYYFKKYPLEFNVELTLKHDKKESNYKMNANFSPEDEVIELLIAYNPKKINSNLYNIIGELNEIMTHELEHGSQHYRGFFDDDDSDNHGEMSSYEYYTQSHEIPAQVKGFRRIAKLRQLPFEEVVRDWFDTHKDIHGLTDQDSERVIEKLIDYNN